MIIIQSDWAVTRKHFLVGENLFELLISLQRFETLPTDLIARISMPLTRALISNVINKV